MTFGELSSPLHNETTMNGLCFLKRRAHIESTLLLRDFALRHQYGQSLPIITNGQVLDRSMTHVKIKGNSALVRMRLPAGFYDGVPSFPDTAEGLALAILVTEEEVPGNAPGGPPASANNPNSASRLLQGESTPAPAPATGANEKEIGKWTSVSVFAHKGSDLLTRCSSPFLLP